MFGSGKTALIISNEEMNDILKVIKSLEESNLLIKGISQAIKDETKEQKKRDFLECLGTLDASLSGNLLKGK